jgi:hypothetical protein
VCGTLCMSLWVTNRQLRAVDSSCPPFLTTPLAAAGTKQGALGLSAIGYGFQADDHYYMPVFVFAAADDFSQTPRRVADVISHGEGRAEGPCAVRASLLGCLIRVQCSLAQLACRSDAAVWRRHTHSL